MRLAPTATLRGGRRRKDSNDDPAGVSSNHRHKRRALARRKHQRKARHMSPNTPQIGTRTVSAKREYLHINDDELREIISENVNKYHRDEIFSDCWQCGQNYPGLGAQVNADGRIQIKAYCTCCDHALHLGPLRVPKELRERIPIIKKSVGDLRACSYRGCSSPYSQTHHILPSSIDWEESCRFPTVPLCVEHHALWHKLTGLGLSTTKTTTTGNKT